MPTVSTSIIRDLGSKVKPQGPEDLSGFGAFFSSWSLGRFRVRHWKGRDVAEVSPAEESRLDREEARWASCVSSFPSSLLHISPRAKFLAPSKAVEFSYRVAEGGSFSQLKHRFVGFGTKVDVGGRRAVITSFSAASAGRLKDYFQKLDMRRQAQGEFSPRGIAVTLTYPAEWERDSDTWKRHLDNFGKALLRKWPEASCIWVLEFQRRGAPHFHAAVLGVDWLPFVWVNSTWKRIIGLEEGEYIRTETQAVRKDLGSYMSKYLSKGCCNHTTVEVAKNMIDCETGEITEDCGVGRFWGIIGRKNLPIEEMLLELPEKSFYAYRRQAARWIRRICVKNQEIPGKIDFTSKVPEKKLHHLSDKGIKVYLQGDTSLKLYLWCVGRDGDYVSSEVVERREKIRIKSLECWQKVGRR